MSEHAVPENLEGIAVIGMAGRFPGARNIREFWELLREGRETVRHFSDEELAAVDYDFDSVRDDPNYVKARGVLDDIDLFDAGFFGFLPREASLLDPQHRVWLECAWQALEVAGYAPEKYGGAIGVFAGGYITSYLLHNLCVDRDYIERLVRLRSTDAFQTLIGNDKDYLPSRTAYKLNLKGPAVNVQTACSTSLVAVSQACQSLLHYESDICLAGGVCITCPQIKGYVYQEGAIVSPDGHCRPFDERAQGTVFSNGIGVVVLKRLEDAVYDGDRIEAVIRGTALNNDGSDKVSYTAPSVEGQAQVIAMAHAAAGVDPRSITYVEAHGTGTPLGDPIEVAGLTKAFRAKTADKQFCGLGSVKSNVGHLDSAAGIAGFIKTVLALRHKQIPPSLHFEQPNPEIDFAGGPFYVVNRLQDWEAPAAPRRAGVSSFGVGGTNVHVVLEEAPDREASGPSRQWQLLPFSAKTKSALDAVTAQLGEHIAQRKDQPLADIAFTLQVGRADFTHRRFLVASSHEDAAQALAAGDKKRLITGSYDDSRCSLVFMFPGQGAQHVHMGRGLYESEPVFREQVEAGAEILQPLLGVDLRALLYPARSADEEEAARQLKQTQVTQPALFVVEYALARLWLEWGFRPEAMIGHSVGEYVAAALSDVFSMEDALKLLAERARLMQDQPPGGMLAVRLSREEAEPYTGADVALAACNGPRLSVLSGPTEAIQALNEKLSAQGVGTRPLHTSHAFHSAMMDPVLEPFAERVRAVRRAPPRIPFISSLTGTWIADDEATDPTYWSRQIRHPVLFSQGIRTLQEESGRVLLEVGPSRTLGSLAAQHANEGARPVVISSLRHAQDAQPDEGSMLEAVGRLWLTGLPPDWSRFYARERRHRVELPTYPFERKRYWIDPPAPGQVPASSTAVHPVEPRTATPVAPVQGAPAGGAQAHDSSQPGHSLSREDRILRNVLALLYELSGIEMFDQDASTDTTFMELGLDSLFLTQASAELQKCFGVKITFRQLLEDLTSVSALVSYLEKELPADAFEEEAPAPPPSGEPLAGHRKTEAPGIATAAAPGDAVERVIAEQLRVMNQQLDMLRVGKSSDEVMQLLASTQARQSGQAPMEADAIDLPDAPSAQGRKTDERRFGPYKKIERAKDGGLTARQRRHLDELVSRVNRRTGESKRLAQACRALLADPRSVAGYRQLWKEMVYQITSVRSEGSKIWDVDGNEYVDITMCFGANLLGHNPPFIRQAIEEQLRKGFEIGPQSLLAGQVAELVRESTGMERVTFCNTGSEAVMAAIRMARTVSGRTRIAFFSGDYHGTFDEVLAREQVLRGKLHTKPAAPGIPESSVRHNLVLDYGTPESLEILRKYAGQLAAILVEPIQSRHPDVRPREFLQAVRQLTRESGTALIFDEVITGFRIGPGGAQAYYDVRADLASYGKVIGGGMPIGLVAGSSAYMDALDGGAWQFGDDSLPEKDVTFFAGTFVRHPLALAAARAVLTHLKEQGPELQQSLNEKTTAFAEELNDFFERSGVPVRLLQFSSWYRFDYPHDLLYAPLLFYHLLEKGVYIREAGQNCFFSTAHSDADIQHVIRAVKESVRELQKVGFLPEAGRAVPSTPGRELEPAADAFPLTEPQKEIWLACQWNERSSCAYNESFTLKLRGPLHVEHLRAAITQVFGRHEALHATFDADGERQRITGRQPVDVPLRDLSGLAEDERRERLRQMLQDEASTPFDLQAGPLFRLQLLKLGEREHHLILSAHHIVCDGASSAILLAEISVVYTALCKGETPELKPANTFRDFALELREQAQGESVEAARAYWLERFRDLPPPLELPTDRPRPRLKSYTGATIKRRLQPETIAAAKEASRRHHATLFSVMLAGYYLLLHRVSGQDELVVGVAAAGQVMAGKETLVGHCVNLLPLRLRFDEGQKVGEYVATVRSAVLDAYEHQQLSYGSLLKDLPLDRDSGRLPLVEVIFNLDRDRSGLGYHGLETEIEQNPKTAVNFELFFNLNETEEGNMVLDCDYNTDLFDESTIQRWIGHYETLLRGLAGDADQPVDALELLSEEERRTILVEWNETERNYPSGTCIHELFEAQARATPGETALVCGETRLSYRELNEQSNRLAHALRERGIGPEKPVGVFLHRSPRMVVGLLGILKAGGAYVPLDPAYPEERLSFILDDAQMALILTQDQLAQRLPQGWTRLCVDGEAQALGEHPAEDLNPGVTERNLAYIIYTSGSTGKPKGVAIEHRSTVGLIHWANELFEDDEVRGTLAATSICFDLSVFEMFVPLSRGGTVLLAENALALPELKARDSVTLVNTVPSAMTELLRAGGLPASVSVVNLAGEPLKPSLVDVIYRQPGVRKVYDLYGPSEDTTYSTCALRKPNAPYTVGRPIANTKAYILDPKMQPVPVGVPGELYLGGLGLAREYLNRPELTAERFVANPFGNGDGSRLYRTGDRARYLPDGNIEYLGRLDYQVKIRGYRIELGEIESVLLTHSQVEEVVVTSAENRNGDKALHAYVASSNGAVSPRALREHLRKQLPDYMVPSTFTVLDELPHTPNGKIDRKALPEPGRERSDGGPAYEPPRGEMEEQLASWWCSLLGIERVGRHDDFFDVGGHSLLAVRLFLQIEKQYGKHLPLATLLEAPTIQRLADIIRGGGSATDWTPIVPLNRAGSNPPFFCIHGAGGNVLLYRDLAKRLGPDQPFYGIQARGLDGRRGYHTNIEDMAAEYVEEIRRVQPEGPYYLGGYCMGGTVAFEIAQRLRQQGQEVALLALFDTHSRWQQDDLPRNLYRLGQKIFFHAANVVILGPKGIASFLREKTSEAARRVERKLAVLSSHLAHAVHLRRENPVVALEKINDRAAEAYVPSPYPGTVTVFKPRRAYLGYEDPLLGWGNGLAAEVEVQDLHCYPAGMLVEPFVAELAAKLSESLKRARARHERARNAA